MIFTLISLLLFPCFSAAEGQVPPPKNVNIVSQDMGLVLEWDPPQDSTGKDFTYTAEFRGWKSFETICMNTLARRCDFTSEITLFGTNDFRVRAELEGKSSEWVQFDSVCLDDITVISAPDVTLESTKGRIEIDITDPVMRKSPLKDYYRLLSYRIYYWIEEEAEKEELKTENSRVILQDITQRVRYCVQVVIAVNINKSSLPSNTTCILNTESEVVQPWLILTVLLTSFAVALVSVVLVFFAVWYIYRGIKFLHPQAHLPDDLKEYLSERPKSALDVQNNLQPEEHYHEVRIIPYLEDPIASKDQSSSYTPPYANLSSKAEDVLNREKELCNNEQRTDNENTERDAALGFHDGETTLLL